MLVEKSLAFVEVGVLLIGFVGEGPTAQLIEDFIKL
jgi:hypothetical protein